MLPRSLMTSSSINVDYRFLHSLIRCTWWVLVPILLSKLCKHIHSLLMRGDVVIFSIFLETADTPLHLAVVSRETINATYCRKND
jgi:hypothetical protein